MSERAEYGDITAAELKRVKLRFGFCAILFAEHRSAAYRSYDIEAAADDEL